MEILYNVFSWVTENQALFVACTTVILLVSNWKLHGHYKRQHALDKFLVFQPLKEKNLDAINEFVSALPTDPKSNNFGPIWSYLKQGRSVHNLDDLPLHDKAIGICSQVEQAECLFSEEKETLKNILNGIHDLDRKIREVERKFPCGTDNKDEETLRDKLVNDYSAMLNKLRIDFEDFIQRGKIHKPPH